MSTRIEVLLVEDSFSDAQMVEAIVSSSNLDKPNLHHAGRFAQALSMLKEQAYDLVLLDLHLPDGQGLDLIKQIKQQAPAIPVVVLTGLQDETTAVAALEEGAQDYVVKSDTFSPTRLSQLGPTDIGDWLIRRIQYAIKRSELIQQQEADQKRYTLANQGNNEGIWDWDLKHNYVYLSPLWKSTLGLYDSALNHHPDDWLTRIHAEDRSRFEQTLQDYLTHRQPQFYCEYRIQHSDGHYIWVLAKGKALWDDTGVAYRMVGSQTDITERKEQEHTAYQKRELAQTVLHTVGAGLLAIQATLYISEGAYEKAEPLLQSSLAMRKSLLGSNHPDVAISLYNLATLYDNQFRFTEAESLFREALAVFQNTLGIEHPHTKAVRDRVNLICRLNQAMHHPSQGN